MAIKTVFSDVKNNELDCSLTTEGKVYIGVAPAGEDGHLYSGSIELEKSDVSELIKVLTVFEKQMKD